MPTAALRILSGYNKNINDELICEICSEQRQEEELKFIELIFEAPDDPEKMAIVNLNACTICIDDFVNNSAINMVRDTFNPDY